MWSVGTKASIDKPDPGKGRKGKRERGVRGELVGKAFECYSFCRLGGGGGGSPTTNSKRLMRGKGGREKKNGEKTPLTSKGKSTKVRD